MSSPIKVSETERIVLSRGNGVVVGRYQQQKGGLWNTAVTKVVEASKAANMKQLMIQEYQNSQKPFNRL